MQKPLPVSDTTERDAKFEELIAELPADMAELARTCKALVRARKITTPQELMRLVFSYGGLDLTLRETGAVNALHGGKALCDESVKTRLLGCQGWIEALLREMLPPIKTVLPEGFRWLVCDGSSVQAAGGTTTHYRLHICLELISCRLVEVLITDHKTGESLLHFSFGAGNVVLADRNFATAPQIVGVCQRQSHLLVRVCAHNLPLFGEDGAKLNLVEELRKAEEEPLVTIPVTVRTADGKGEAKGYLHAARLHSKDAEKARRRVRKESKRHGRTPKAETLFYANWVLLFTTLTPEQVSAKTAAELYRLRWQVELLIKRLKSLLDVDLLRARRGSPLAKLWLHAKFLYAVLVDKRACQRAGPNWSSLSSEEHSSWWRVWNLVALELDSAILGSAHWTEEAWKNGLGVLNERPRRRKPQSFPQTAWALLFTFSSHC